MSNFNDLANVVKERWLRDVYAMIADKYADKGYISDGVCNISFTADELESIQAYQYEQVKENMLSAGLSFVNLETAKEQAYTGIANKMLNLSNNYVKDGFYNPVSNIGTIYDPGTANTAFSPVSMSPSEATSYYSSRGLGSLIIDKKSKVPLLNGFRFVDGLEAEDLAILLEHAKRKSVDKFIIAGIRDGLIYGGAAIVPVFNRDNYDTYALSLDDLARSGILDKGCLNYFFTVDRWNMVVMPNYDITAKDYLSPDHVFIPFGSMKMSTQRMAMIKPYPQPFWSAIRQLGWSNSDFEGYIRQLLAYNILIAAIPIMAQQMSLLIHEFPLDGVLAQNGPTFMKEFIKQNESQLRDWSILNPKAMNSAGKISVIERNFIGFRGLVETSREDVASNADLPVSNLWYLQAKGMSADNEQDTTLKQSESIKKIETEVKPQLKALIKILIIDCFGINSPQAAKANEVNIDFNSPIVISNKERADIAVQFGNFVSGMTNAGMPLDMALRQAQNFFPDYQVDEGDMEILSTPVEGDNPEGFFGNLNQQQDTGFFSRLTDGLKRFTIKK